MKKYSTQFAHKEYIAYLSDELISKQKTMETKNATIRLPLDLAEWMTEGGEKSINQAVIANAETLRKIRQVSTGELKGKLSEAEWKFLADSLNGTLITEPFRCSQFALWAHCEDAERFDGTGSKWEVDMEGFKAKVLSLTGAQVDALYARVESFWDKPDRDLDEWAKW